MSLTYLPIDEILEPPDELDGADVLLWAYSPQKPFFRMIYSDGTDYKAIHGFAICRYQDTGPFYKFSCDSAWNVENDSDHANIDEALRAADDLSEQPISWHKKESWINNM